MDPGQGTVLLVEDEDSVLMVLSSHCERLGLAVIPCHSLVEAAPHLREPKFDIAIVDHRLGGDDDGLDFLVDLQTRHGDCCRILTSGATDPDLLIAAINRGHIDAFLAKPIRTEACFGLIGRALEIVRLRRQNRDLVAQLATRNQELEQSTNELAAAVRERTAHLEEVSRRLQEKHHELVRLETQGAVGHLVRGLAHELNNPLAVILGFTQRLQRQTSDAETNRRLEVVVTEVDRCRGLVERLRRLAAPLEEELVPCSPVETITHALVKVREQLGAAANAGLVLRYDQELPAVQAGPRSLERVCEQILINAVQAGASMVALSYDAGNERLQWHIDNDGSTPTEAEIANATRPFFTTRSTTGGRGLGLAIAAGLLREQDGTLTLVERPGGSGARITISLPMAASSGRYHRLQRVEAHPQVLVVDDEPLIAELLADCLTEIGCNVRTVASSKEAWKLIVKQPLRAIISDLHLADGSGIELLERAMAAHPHLVGHVALVTGDLHTPELRRAVDRAGLPLLSKPFRLEQMTEFVARLL